MNPGVTTRYLMWKLPQIGGGEKWWKSHPMGSKPLNIKSNPRRFAKKKGIPEVLKLGTFTKGMMVWERLKSDSSHTGQGFPNDTTPERNFCTRMAQKASVPGKHRKVPFLLATGLLVLRGFKFQDFQVNGRDQCVIFTYLWMDLLGL